MNNSVKRNLKRNMKMTTLYILVTGVAMTIIFPIFFLFSFSMMSDYETYSEWPKPLLPRVTMNYRMDRIDEEAFLLSIWNVSEDRWMPFGPERNKRTPDDVKKLSRFMNNYGNTEMSEDEVLAAMDRADVDGFYEFSRHKSIIHNYRRFFRLYSNAARSIVASLTTAALTIVISISIGGMAGYAFARYAFKGKNILKLSVLFVRMFPPVAIAIPMVVILGKIGLYDKPAGLSLIYSINQISMNIWITASIFMAIPESLEEAAQLFGTNRAGAFFRVTMPLAVPGLAACAMYSFLYSWNEVINAIILTQFNPTFPVVVYQSLLGANAQVHLIAAGSIAQALPAIIFTLFIRKYILQMWGGVKV